MRTTATPAHHIRRTGALSIATVLAVASLAACGGDGEDVGTVSVPAAPAPSPATTGGGATSGPSDAADAQDPETAVEVEEGVTAQRAQEIALDLYPGTMVELELDDDDGRTVWEVDIDGDDGWEYEVEIDARTGEVVKQERDDRVDD